MDDIRRVSIVDFMIFSSESITHNAIRCHDQPHHQDRTERSTTTVTRAETTTRTAAAQGRARQLVRLSEAASGRLSVRRYVRRKANIVQSVGLIADGLGFRAMGDDALLFQPPEPPHFDNAFAKASIPIHKFNETMRPECVVIVYAPPKNERQIAHP